MNSIDVENRKDFDVTVVPAVYGKRECQGMSLKCEKQVRVENYDKF